MSIVKRMNSSGKWSGKLHFDARHSWVRSELFLNIPRIPRIVAEDTNFFNIDSLQIDIASVLLISTFFTSCTL